MKFKKFIIIDKQSGKCFMEAKTREDLIKVLKKGCKVREVKA